MQTVDGRRVYRKFALKDCTASAVEAMLAAGQPVTSLLAGVGRAPARMAGTSPAGPVSSSGRIARQLAKSVFCSIASVVSCCAFRLSTNGGRVYVRRGQRQHTRLAAVNLNNYSNAHISSALRSLGFDGVQNTSKSRLIRWMKTHDVSTAALEHALQRTQNRFRNSNSGRKSAFHGIKGRDLSQLQNMLVMAGYPDARSWPEWKTLEYLKNLGLVQGGPDEGSHDMRSKPRRGGATRVGKSPRHSGRNHRKDKDRKGQSRRQWGDAEDDFYTFHLDDEAWDPDPTYESPRRSRRSNRKGNNSRRWDRDGFDDLDLEDMAMEDEFDYWEDDDDDDEFEAAWTERKEFEAAWTRRSWQAPPPQRPPQRPPAQRPPPKPVDPANAMAQAVRERWSPQHLSRVQAAMLLGIPQHASAQELRRAKRTSILRWHPDCNPKDPNSEAALRLVVAAADLLDQGS